jgi:hypothetical protein
MIYNELFESIIRTSGQDTDDVFAEYDNFWAPVPIIERMFEQVLRKAHLQEMARLKPDSVGNILMVYIYNYYYKLRDNLLSLVRNALNDMVDRGRPLIFIMSDETPVTVNNIDAFANATTAHCEGIVKGNSSDEITNKSKKGLNPYGYFTKISETEFEINLKPLIKDNIKALFQRRFTKFI